MKELTHWKKLINPIYIGAYSIEKGKDLNVTIEKVVREMVIGNGGKKEECTVAYLKGQKPFILNRTNSKMITRLLGTPYIEEWAGKSITLFISTTKVAGGDNVECLRIRPVLPQSELPTLLVSDVVNFENVKIAIGNGYTLEQIKTKWTIPHETQIALNL